MPGNLNKEIKDRAEKAKRKKAAQTKSGKKKVAKVMDEFKSGSLRSSSGDKVTNPKQAIAIALSEAERAGK